MGEDTSQMTGNGLQLKTVERPYARISQQELNL